jgi:hypothetical protein
MSCPPGADVAQFAIRRLHLLRNVAKRMAITYIGQVRQPRGGERRGNLRAGPDRPRGYNHARNEE